MAGLAFSNSQIDVAFMPYTTAVLYEICYKLVGEEPIMHIGPIFKTKAR